VCYRVLQCIASVFPCVSVCCSVLQFLTSPTIARWTIARWCVCEGGRRKYSSVLQCVAVCCSVLQCVAVFTELFEKRYTCVCVAGYCSVEKVHVCVRGSVFQCVAVSKRYTCVYVAVCCNVLQCVLQCSCIRHVASAVLQCVAVCCSVLQCFAVFRSVLHCSTVQCSKV